MARPKIRDAEIRDLDSLWRELKTMEADYGAITSILAQPTARPGVFSFRLEFTPIEARSEESVRRAAYTIEFPTANIQTLAGALWSASMRLAKQIGDTYYDVRTRARLK